MTTSQRRALHAPTGSAVTTRRDVARSIVDAVESLLLWVVVTMLSDEQLAVTYHPDTFVFSPAHMAGLRAVEAAVRADAKAEALEEAAKAGARYVVNPNTSRDYQEGASHADIYWQLALERAAAAIRAQLTEGTDHE